MGFISFAEFSATTTWIICNKTDLDMTTLCGSYCGAAMIKTLLLRGLFKLMHLRNCSSLQAVLAQWGSINSFICSKSNTSPTLNWCVLHITLFCKFMVNNDICIALPLFGRSIQQSDHISQHTASSNRQDRLRSWECDSQQWQLSYEKTETIFLKIFMELQWWSLIQELPFSSCSHYLGTCSAQD